MHSNYLDFETSKEPSRQTLVDEYIDSYTRVKQLELELYHTKKNLIDASDALSKQLIKDESSDDVLIESRGIKYYVSLDLEDGLIKNTIKLDIYP